MYSFRMRSPRAFAGIAIAAVVAAALIVVLSSGGGVASAKTNRSLVRASAQLAATSPRIPATATCASMAADPNLITIPGNPTSIDSATDVPAASGNPEYCDLKGMIAPQTHFEMKLPVSTSAQRRDLFLRGRRRHQRRDRHRPAQLPLRSGQHPVPDGS